MPSMKSCIGGTIVITMGCWRFVLHDGDAFVETIVAYDLRTLEEIDDTFGVVEYLALHFRADRLAIRTVRPRNVVSGCSSLFSQISPLTRQKDHVLHASCLRDHVPFRIKTILEYVPLVETTRGTVGIFGAAMVG